MTYCRLCGLPMVLLADGRAAWCPGCGALIERRGMEIVERAPARAEKKPVAKKPAAEIPVTGKIHD
jgi:uncharacterized Zn finger protein (UPF0148 family)